MTAITKGELLQEKDSVSKMYKDMRSWATFSIVLGIISIFSFGTFDPAWGILMIVVGLLSWKVKIPGMYAIYAVIMGWAAVTNALTVFSGEGNFWFILAVIQVGWTIMIVKQMRKYRQLHLQDLYQAGMWPPDLDPPQDEQKISQMFATASAAIAATAWGLISIACLAIFVLVLMFYPTIMDQSQLPEASTPPASDTGIPLADHLFSLYIYAVILSQALGFAALASRTQNRGLAIAGATASSIFLAFYLMLLVLGSIATFVNPAWAG